MFFLGVDIGGTKTAAVITDETIEEVCKDAGIRKNDIHNAYFGIAGVDLDYDIKIIKEILKRIGIKKYAFENDGLIALRSGTVDGKGILVTCGTGSISFANNGEKVLRKGGFSTFFGERLGAGHIARLSASAIIRAKDGRGPKTLMNQLLEKEHSITIEEIMKVEIPDVEYTGPDPVVTLITIIYKAARQNDFVALKILLEITEEVLNIVKSFRADMAFEPVVPVVLEGTVFKKADSILFDLIRSGLGDDFNIIIPKHDPVTGAALFALENVGIMITKPIRERLFNSYEKKKAEIQQ